MKSEDSTQSAFSAAVSRREFIVWLNGFHRCGLSFPQCLGRYRRR